MSFNDDFDDDLDHLLAHLTASQLTEPLRNNQLNVESPEDVKSIAIQTNETFCCKKVFKPSFKRKLVIIKTAKHHHIPCIYHSSSQEVIEHTNKRLKSNSDLTKHLDDNYKNDENYSGDNTLQLSPMTINELTTEISPQMSDNNSQPIDTNLSQTLVQSSNSSQQSCSSQQIKFSGELDVDVERSPLHQLNGTNRWSVR